MDVATDLAAADLEELTSFLGADGIELRRPPRRSGATASPDPEELGTGPQLGSAGRRPWTTITWRRPRARRPAATSANPARSIRAARSWPCSQLRA
jgi:hypothetical protein